MSHVNNFIIGLGGAGGRSLAAFRRACLLREKEQRDLAEHQGTRYRYLYIDSDGNDIAAAREGYGVWNMGGKSLQLSEREIVHLSPHGMSAEAVSKLPNISPWIGDRDMWRKAPWDSVRGGSGLSRRCGRVLFAANAAVVNDRLNNGIESLVGANARAADGITFHIFATVGGGTGSGCIVDTITLAQRICAEANYKACFYLYLYVGGNSLRVQASDVGFFYGNEYTTLRDINALMCNRYHPFLAGLVNPADEECHELGNLVEGVFLSSDDAFKSQNLREQEENMTKCCYELISNMNHAYGPEGYTDCDMCHYLFAGKEYSGEIEYPENGKPVHNRVPEDTSPERYDNFLECRTAALLWGCRWSPERHYHFFGCRTVSLRYPNEAIETILKSTLALQVYDRWLYGTRGEEKDACCYRELLSAEPLEDVQLARELDAFAAPFLQKYGAEQAKKDCLTTVYDKNLLDEINADVVRDLKVIEQETEKVLHNNSSGAGDRVGRLAQMAAVELESRLMKLVKQLRRWQPDRPGRGLVEIRESLSCLRDQCSEACPEAQPDAVDMGCLEKRAHEWKKLGFFSRMLSSKVEKMFRMHYQEACAVLNRALARYRKAVAWQVKRHLSLRIDSMMPAIDMLIGDIEEGRRREEELRKEAFAFLKEPNEAEKFLFNEAALMRHVANIESPLSENTMYLPVMAELEKVWEWCVDMEKLLDAAECRRAFKCELRMQADELFRDIVWRIHDEAVEKSPTSFERVLLSSVYEVLNASSHSPLKDSDLSPMESVLGRLSLPIRLCAHNAPGGSGMTVNSPDGYLSVGLPGEMVREERKRWEACLRVHVPSGRRYVYLWMRSHIGETVKNFLRERTHLIGESKFECYVHDDPYEIRIMKMAYGMPLRFISVVEMLQHRYKLRMDDDAYRTYSYFTNADDDGMCTGNENRPALIPERL